MRPAEVVALEGEQVDSPNGIRTLVPRVLGATERAVTAKSVTPRQQSISEAEWLDMLAAAKGDAARRGAERAVARFRSQGFVVGLTARQDALYATLGRPSGKQNGRGEGRAKGLQEGVH